MNTPMRTPEIYSPHEFCNLRIQRQKAASEGAGGDVGIVKLDE